MYQLNHYYQDILIQMITHHTLIPFFSLSCKPHLEDQLYQRLKQWVQIEDTLVDDNSEALKREM